MVNNPKNLKGSYGIIQVALGPGSIAKPVDGAIHQQRSRPEQLPGPVAEPARGYRLAFAVV